MRCRVQWLCVSIVSLKTQRTVCSLRRTPAVTSPLPCSQLQLSQLQMLHSLPEMRSSSGGRAKVGAMLRPVYICGWRLSAMCMM